MAHDVSQQAFVKAYKYLHSFNANHSGLGNDPENRFRNWLTGIATNCHSDLAKSESKYSELQDKDWHNIETTDISQPRHDLNEFEAMIQPLTAQERQLITLRFVYEFSIDEIASMVGLKSGTVKSKISRTVSKLRSKLENAAEEVKIESNGNAL